MRLALIVQSGAAAGREIFIRKLPFFIGRGPDADLRTKSPHISLRHAALLFHDGKIHVRDLASTNGTVVNGQLIRGQEVVVDDGTVIELGGARLLLKVTRRSPTPRAGSSKAAGDLTELAPPASGDTVRDGPPLSASDTAALPPLGAAPPAGPDKPATEQSGKPDARPRSKDDDTAQIASKVLQAYLRRMREGG